LSEDLIDWVDLRRRSGGGERGPVEPPHIVIVVADPDFIPDRMVRFEVAMNDVGMMIAVRSRDVDML